MAAWVVVLICILSAQTNAIQAVLNRVLQHIPVNIIITYHSILGTVLLGAFILIEAAITGNGFRFTEYTGRQYGYLLGAVLFDSVCLFMATIAY